MNKLRSEQCRPAYTLANHIAVFSVAGDVVGERALRYPAESSKLAHRVVPLALASLVQPVVNRLLQNLLVDWQSPIGPGRLHLRPLRLHDRRLRLSCGSSRQWTSVRRRCWCRAAWTLLRASWLRQSLEEAANILAEESV